MMKLIGIFFLLLTFGLTLNAQDYAPILAGRTAYFVDASYNAAYQIDTTYQSGDTLVSLLYKRANFCQPFEELRTFDQLNYLASEELLLTEKGHHIYLNTLAGEAWTFLRSPQGDSIAAQHISTDWIPVFGAADSVKIILLSQYDPQGQIAPNGYWHDVQLLLSKEHGVLRSIDAYNKPLTYLSNPNIGQNPLTDLATWDMEVGAELHIFEGGESSMPLSQEYTRWVILDKQITPNADTISLSIDRMFVSYQTQVASEIDTFIHDSILLRIPLYQKQYLPGRVYETGGSLMMSRFPLSGSADFQYSVQYGSRGYFPIGGRRAISMFPYHREILNPTETCWREEWYPKVYEGIQGWGGWYYHTAGIDWNIDRKPIYYRDSDETWGSPYDFGSLVTAIELETEADFRAALFPNPSDGALQLYVSEGFDELEISFYSLSGQFLERFPLSRPSSASSLFPLDLRHFAAGIYFYELVAEGQRSNGKIVIR